MSTRYSVPAGHIAGFVNALSVLAGFLCLGTDQGRSRLISALPHRQWQFGDQAGAFAATVGQVVDAHGAIAGADHCGFIAGCLFYEAGRHTVPGFRSRRPPMDSLGWAGLYLWHLKLDDNSGAGTPALLSFDDACPAALKTRVLALLEQSEQAPPLPPFRITTPFRARGTEEDYRRGVARILDYIHAGDCYQANLSQQFEGRFHGSPWLAWQALVQAIPVPHGGFLDAGPWQLLSVSPELFLDIADGQVISKPIKGTRPRSEDPAQDRALARELAENSKDRAENLMIVDLIRNDLSHFCEPFSVQVPALFAVESYRNVHQLVSTVTGRLSAGTSPFEAMVSAFPGGSITGAPKRRAMEIIDELESHGRGPYCGSLFRWQADNRLESNIAIRSLQARTDGVIRAWAGCGLVADSDPGDEYRESPSKIQRLLTTLENPP